MAFPTYLITPAELNRALLNPSPHSRIVPICASWFLPNDAQKRTGAQVFAQGRVPGARFFDIDQVKGDSPYPHMLPTAEVFATAMRDLGVRKEDVVVVYDTAELGIFSAPRVGWTFKIFGHERVHVLNNFALWVEAGYSVTSGPPDAVTPSSYPVPTLDAAKVVSFDEMKMKTVAAARCADAQVLDARPHGRWTGADPEPRPGLPSGHMPGSVSVPFNELLDPQTKTLLPRDRLRGVFEDKGVDASRPIISSCGTGVTAAVVDAALSEAFGSGGSRRLYDGSWTEWAQRVTETEGLIEKTA